MEAFQILSPDYFFAVWTLIAYVILSRLTRRGRCKVGNRDHYVEADDPEEAARLWDLVNSPRVKVDRGRIPGLRHGDDFEIKEGGDKSVR